MPGRRINLTLPYPPSINRYWRRVGRRVLISRAGRAYRKCIFAELLLAIRGPRPILAGAIDVRILAHPPDARERDLDNIQKALFDALEHGGMFQSDSQIRHIDICWGAVRSGGAVELELSEM